MRLLVVLLAVTVTTPAFAGRVSKPIHVLRPPALDMPATPSIAVAGVTGWNGEGMEALLVEALLDPNRGLGWNEGLGPDDAVVVHPNHTPIVDRTRFQQARRGAWADAIPAGEASQLARELGAGVVVLGDLSPPFVTEEWGVETETEEVEVTETEVETETSVEVEVEEDIFGDDEVNVRVTETDTVKETTRVQEQEVVTEACLTRRIELVFSIRAVDPATSQVLGSASVRGSGQDSVCADTEADALAAIAQPEAIAAEAMRGVAYRGANQVAPYWGTAKLVMERNKRTRDGVVLYKRDDDLPGAAAWFVAAADADPYDEWLQYHAGLFLAATFHFDDARKRLQAARAVKNRKVFDRLARLIDRFEADYRALVALGLPMQPIALQAAAAAAVEEVVVLRGDRKRLSALMPEAGGMGAALAQLTGGMTLTFLAEAGDWVQVRTFDGKVGWVHADNLK
jgi:hypothetical protein